MTALLPPAPDRFGRPRPPAAPVVSTVVSTRSGPAPSVVATHHQVAADGQYGRVGDDSSYPLLESAGLVRAPSLRRAFGIGAGALALPLAALALVLLAIGAEAGTVVVTGVVAGLMLLWFAGSVLLSGGGEVLEVAARGIAVREPGQDVAGTVVDLYLLSEVLLRDTDSGPVLELRQWLSGLSRAVGVSVPCGLLEGNPDAWALVHLGIRHSEAQGAAIDARTRTLLDLPGGNGGPVGSPSSADTDRDPNGGST